MNEYIQVGTTALRDPVTGGFLPAVPLYIRAEDQRSCEAPVIEGDTLQKSLADKFAAYRKTERKARKGS